MQKKIYLLLLCLMCVLGLNIYFRSFPIYFPQLKKQANQIVKQSIQQAAMQDVYKQFPQFYPTAKDEIVRSRIEAYTKQNRKIIQSQRQDIYRKLKEKYQDESGQTYLMELDCWHWARYVENVLKSGHPGDEVIDGKQWDKFMIAPRGDFLSWGQLLFYLSAFLYKAFSLFTPVPLFTFLFYLPLFFTCIFIIALFMFSSKYGGYSGATVSCLFAGLAPVFLPRSCAGWFDTDILNLLFPLLITWAYLLSVERTSRRCKLLWIGVSSLLIGLFSLTWWYWWFIFLIILFSEAFYLGCSVVYHFYLGRTVRHKESESKALQGNENLILLREHIIAVCLFCMCSLLSVRIFSGNEPFLILLNQIRQAPFLNKPLMTSIWPNVFSTVGELRRMNLREIGQTIAPSWIVVFSLLCMAAIAIRAFLFKSFSKAQRSAIVIFVMWYVLMLFATMRGVRFAVFLLVPFAVCLGWGVHDICVYFRNRNSRIGIGIVACVIIILCVSLVNKGHAVAKSIYPLMDDTWYKVLNLVKEKTPQETIINSWWDFGDWFKVVARRRVIFDGQSQHLPQAYWMAKALLTDDENKSIGILRMLNNGGNKAFEMIDEHLKNQLLSVLLLEGVIGLPSAQAKASLAKFLPEALTEKVLKVLLSAPSPAGFVVDHTMPYKMPAISYLGNWEFPKVYIAQNFHKMEEAKIIEYLKTFGANEDVLRVFYQEAFLISVKNLDDWLSRRLQFYSTLLNGREENGVVLFENGFTYTIADRSIRLAPGQIPRSVFVLSENNLIEAVNPNATVPFSILVFQAKEGYKLIALDRELARSMFVRLYFFNGKGLTHFAPFIDAEEGNNYIRFFNIIW